MYSQQKVNDDHENTHSYHAYVNHLVQLAVSICLPRLSLHHEDSTSQGGKQSPQHGARECTRKGGSKVVERCRTKRGDDGRR